MPSKSQVEMTSAATHLADQLSKCRDAIETRRVGWEASKELMRLFAGLYVFALMPLISEHDTERRAINAVLRSRIGLGYSWYTCLKFLSGARARSVFAEHGDIAREIGGSEIMLAFNRIMPALPEMLARIDRELART